MDCYAFSVQKRVILSSTDSVRYMYAVRLIVQALIFNIVLSERSLWRIAETARGVTTPHWRRARHAESSRAPSVGTATPAWRTRTVKKCQALIQTKHGKCMGCLSYKQPDIRAYYVTSMANTHIILLRPQRISIWCWVWESLFILQRCTDIRSVLSVYVLRYCK